jgi:hypothetical protein
MVYPPDFNYKLWIMNYEFIFTFYPGILNFKLQIPNSKLSLSNLSKFSIDSILNEFHEFFEFTGTEITFTMFTN